MDLSFLLVGGSYWLDLVNTEYMSDGENRDLLTQDETVLEWLIQSGLMSRGTNIEDIDGLTPRLKSLRQLFLQLLSAIEANTPFSKSVKDQLSKTSASLRLSLTIGMREQNVYEEIQGATLQDEVLYKLIHSFVETHETIPHNRIRQCQHDECVLYFLDLSKSGKRKWCRMETCGNRVKAAKFYHKKKKEE